MLVTNTTALFALLVLVVAFPCRQAPCGGARETAYEVMKVAQLFELQHGRLPSSLDELTHEIDGRGRLMERIPKDPFGGPYVLVLRSNTQPGFGILSPGEDGLFFTDDDVSTW